MIRILSVAAAAGLLFSIPGFARADQQVSPAFFILASDDLSATAAAPDSIIRVAAQTEIPQLKYEDTTSVCTDCGFIPAATSDSILNTANQEPPRPDATTSNNSTSQNTCNNSCHDDCHDSCHNDCRDNCNDDCNHFCPECFHPTWTFKAGAVVLDRVSPRSTALVVETSTGNSLMNASGFSFNWNGGVDASLLRRIGDDNVLEIRYFGVDAWRARQSIVTTDAAHIPIFPAFPIPIGSDVTSQFETNLASTEVNWRHETSDRFSWLAGFRWMEMHDSLGITVTNTPIRSVTDNQLYGGQLGADLLFFDDGSPLHIDSVYKVGLYDNSTDNLQESRNQLAFVGEIGVTAVYQCCEHVAIRAGYQVLWLDGVSVATDQIPVTNLVTGRGLDSTGNAFYHGALFSLDCTW